MNRLFFATALSALALATPIAAQAQTLPPAIVAVIDRNRIAATCTPCVAATQQLQAQGQQYQAREQQLLGPLQTEQQAIQTALAALPQGGQPDAALQQRIQTWRTNGEAAERELQRAQQTLQRNQSHVVEQILQRMEPLIRQVMQQRGANLAVDLNATLAHNPAVNVTDGVLALMNQNTAAFQTVAPPPAAQPAAQQPTPQPNRPRPQGR